MASQFLRVTGNPASRSGAAHAILQAKINRLPQRLANQQQKKILARDAAFQQKQISLAEKQALQRKREQEAAMGLEAAKFGLNIGMSDMGKKTLGDITAGAKDMYGGAKKQITNKPYAPATPSRSAVGNLPIGSALASGLTGYGIGKLIGGKNQTKKSIWGAGAGALMGMLSAPSGGGMMGGLFGGLAGGLGGIFS